MAVKMHVHHISTSILFCTNFNRLICYIYKKKICIYNLYFDVKLLFKRLWLCILDLIDFQKCTVQGNSNWKANNAPECSKCWCINLKKWIMLTPAIYFIKKCLLCSINKTPKVHVQVNINIYIHSILKKYLK